MDDGDEVEEDMMFLGIAHLSSVEEVQIVESGDPKDNIKETSVSKLLSGPQNSFLATSINKVWYLASGKFQETFH